jgi:hypothetical protein
LGKSFDLSAAVVNTAARRRNQGAAETVFSLAERQDRMSKNEKPESKRARSEREKEAERRAREKALDDALRDTFPASDPVAPSEPAPSRE